MEISDNELIAEFMGIHVRDWNGLLYHSDEEGYVDIAGDAQPYWPDKSWNQLMPVVEKIYKLNPRAFDIDKEIGPLSPLAELHIYDNIDVVYKAVVDFVKWYNANQPKS